MDHLLHLQSRETAASIVAAATNSPDSTLRMPAATPTRIFVGRVPADATADQLRTLFEREARAIDETTTASLY